MKLTLDYGDKVIYPHGKVIGQSVENPFLEDNEEQELCK